MKTKTKQIIMDILAYLTANRQIGHTTSMLNGALNTDAIVITHNQDMADRLKLNYKHLNVVSINSLNKLKDCNKPILFDNAAIHELLTRVLED